MTKKQMIRKLAKRTIFSQAECAQVVDNLFAMLSEEFREGRAEELTIKGFGRFFIYEHTPRPVRNMKTQEDMILKPYKSLKFKPCKTFKKLLKEKSYNKE